MKCVTSLMIKNIKLLHEDDISDWKNSVSTANIKSEKECGKTGTFLQKW